MRTPLVLAITAGLAITTGCSRGHELLGEGDHTEEGVNITTIGTSDDGLDVPRDIAAHGVREGELWLVNRAESIVVIQDAGTDPSFQFFGPTSGTSHFLAQPSAIACGMNGNCATAHETDQKTQGPMGTPADFMGPSLWPTDLDLFDAGHSSHYDMLHNSPLGMGIAWDAGNAYWVFDGYHNSVTYYDFVHDHGPGGSDHSDGIIRRYSEGEVAREADIPSHMQVDHATNRLYIADTGNQRIAVLDTESGELGGAIPKNYDGVDQKMMNDADLDTFVDGQDLGEDLFGKEVPFTIDEPSGLVLHEDHLFVSDYSAGRIVVFNMDGIVVDWVDVGGDVTGLAVDTGGNLYFVDVAGNEIRRIAPPE